MTTTAGQVLPLVFDWPIECGDQAPGNILARRMRYIFEDTQGLFPPSRRGTRTVNPNGQPDKYNSIYEMDFNGKFWDRKEFRAARPASEIMKKRSKLVRPERRVNSSTVFMNWKIPKKVFGATENNENETDESTDKTEESSKEEENETKEENETTTKLPLLQLKSVLAPAQASVPVLPPERSARPAQHLPTPPESGSSSPGSASRRAGHARRTQETVAPTSLDPGVLNPVVMPRAAELLRESNPTERRIIEKALLLNDRSAASDSLAHALQPEAAVKVKRWLDTAQPEEREVVLKFFHSVSGNKRQSPGETEKKELLSKVMEAFKRGRASYVSQSHPHFTKGDGLSKLKHLRLQTPNTRRNQWMHTTWHHLPTYKETAWENVGSHYERPHLPVPRHFTIHPDWGS